MFARISRDLRSIFVKADADPDAYAALDAANPYWDCSFDTESGGDFNADDSDYSTTPSLDL